MENAFWRHACPAVACAFIMAIQTIMIPMRVLFA